MDLHGEAVWWLDRGAFEMPVSAIGGVEKMTPTFASVINVTCWVISNHSTPQLEFGQREMDNE